VEVMATDYRSMKPKKEACQLVDLLKNEKGVTFSIISEEDAVKYLSITNNYLRTASYRKNYQKYTHSEKKDKYVNLDFAYLAELSTIDYYLREILLQMCIDVEHALKVMIVDAISTCASEDGYSIVNDFLSENRHVYSSIGRKANAVFTMDLIDKYFELCYVFNPNTGECVTKILRNKCPVWVFMEIISFGDLVRFYNFCVDRGVFQSILLPSNILNPVKSLRNACAHNNCLLNTLSPSYNTDPPEIITRFVASINGMPTLTRKKKLRVRPLFEIVCLLYSFKMIVSENVRKAELTNLRTFVDGRMIKHLDYFTSNALVSSTLYFLKKTVDNLC